MAFSFATPGYRAPIEDVLAHLPISATQAYRKGQIIYGPDQPSANICLIVAGKVKLSQITEDGSEILLDIILPNELFGESAFVNGLRLGEQAIALESAELNDLANFPQWKTS